MILNNFKKEIKMIGELVEQDEIVENATILVRDLGGLKQYLGVLTSTRLLTTDNQKKVVTYNYSNMLNTVINSRRTSTEIKFQYGSEEIQINVLTSDNGNLFLRNLQEKLNILPAPQVETEERKVVRVMKPIKMSIEILNGKEQLKNQGSVFKLSQTKPGSIEISVNYGAYETFKLIKWERV